MTFHRLAIALAAISLVGGASAQLPPDPSSPSYTDCAAIFSVVIADEREAGAAASDRANAARRLYVNNLRLAIAVGDHPDRASAVAAVRERALGILKVMETDEGADLVAQSMDRCIVSSR